MRTHPSPARPARLRHSALVAAVALALAPLGSQAAVVTFTVSTALENGTLDPPVLSFRDVLTAVNSHPGCGTDEFHVNFSGPFVISPAIALPVLMCPNTKINASTPAMDGVVFDGTLMAGDTCVLRTYGGNLVSVNKLNFQNFDTETVLCGRFNAVGNKMTNVFRGMSLSTGSTADGNDIEGDYGILMNGAGSITRNMVTFSSWEGISGQSDGYGGPTIENNTVNTTTGFFGIVSYLSPAVKNNSVSGAYIGLSVNGDGMQVVGNTVIDNTYGGIVANNGAVIEGNFIGGNETGIYANGVTLRGNFIGTFGGRNPNEIGIYDESSYGGVVIEDNFVSGNTQVGIYLDSRNGRVSGNKVGTDSTGMSRIPNDGVGIFLGRNVANYDILDNTVSGNSGPGIFVEADGDGLNIWDNRIGVAQDGKTGLGNGLIGIDVPCGGFMVSLKRNTVSGNGSHGIWLAGVLGDATYGTVEGNHIGTSSDDSVPLPNAGNGLTLAAATSVICAPPVLVAQLTSKEAAARERKARLASATAQRRALALATAKALVRPKALDPLATNDVPVIGNTIWNNFGSGIEVRDGGQGNHWVLNSIFNNRVKNIDLNGGAALANDDGDIDTGTT